MEFKKALKHSAITKYLNLLVNIFFAGVLARLLSPDDFGIVAVVSVFSIFFTMFTDVGIGVGVVQYNDLGLKQLSSLFFLSLFIGLLLGIAFYFFSYVVAFFYENELYIKICKIFSVSLLLSSITVLPNALLRKESKFRTLGIINIATSVLSGIVAIVMAKNDFGYWSLIYRMMLSSFLIFVFSFYYSRIKIEFTFSLIGLRSMLTYSAYNFLFNVVNYFSRNLDNLLIGKFIGFNALGLYEKSYTLMRLPLDNTTVVITPILHPVLRKKNLNTTELFEVHIRLVRLLMLIGVSLSVCLYFVSDSLVLLMYGNQWVESAEPFKWLALSIWAQMILSSTGAFFQVSGKSKWLFISGLASSLLMIFAILLGISQGSVVLISQSLLIAFILNIVQTFYILGRSVFSVSGFYIYKILWGHLVYGILLFAMLYSLNSLDVFNQHIMSIFIILASVFSCLIYLLVTKDKDGLRDSLTRML